MSASASSGSEKRVPFINNDDGKGNTETYAVAKVSMAMNQKTGLHKRL